MNSWVDISPDSDFSIHNLPFGIFSFGKNSPRVGVRIGDYVINLEQMRKMGLLEVPRHILNQSSLNAFISLGKKKTNEIRLHLQNWLINSQSPLKKHFNQIFHPVASIKMHLPVKVGDYTDFYSSLEHATNVGKMFRPDNPLVANWKHMPIAYHGRASSIVISGTPVIRPKGQIKSQESLEPVFSPTKELDFEVEIGAIIGKNSPLGTSLSTSEAENYIFGLVLFNDWSARDIQRWEYQPLGPFLGKNFASSISPWVVTLEALEHFRVDTPTQNPKPLPYLHFNGKRNFDIGLEVTLKTDNDKSYTVSHTNYSYMYWNLAQQVAHHTINGCNLKVGDILASGTISGPEPGTYGSLLEISHAGKQPLHLDHLHQRTFLENGDTLIIKGSSSKDGIRVGFGEVSARILAAI